MRPYTGIQPETLPEPTAPDFLPRLRSKLTFLDYWARDASFGFNRIIVGQNPDGSGDPLGGDVDGGIFFRLQGRPSGQIAHFSTGSGGGGVLASTTDGTKGKIFLGNAQLSAYDEANNRLGVGTASPSATLHASGATTNDLTLRPAGTRVVAGSEWEWRGQDGGMNIESYVNEVTADDNNYMKIRVGQADFQAQFSAVLLLPTPSSTPSASNTHTLRIRYRRTGTGGIGAPTGPGIDAAIYKNGILVAGGSYISIAEAALSGSFTEATATLNATQITNLGNYQGLEVWVNWTGSPTGASTGSEMQVSFVELDCGTSSTVVPIAKFDDGGIGLLPSWTWNTGLNAVTPDLSTDVENTTRRLSYTTSNSVDIFDVRSNGATTINVPFSTYSGSNPIALTLQMSQSVTPNNPMFRVRTFSTPDVALSNVFTVGYNGATRIDMSANSIAFSIQQTSGATADFIFLESSAGIGLLGVDSNGDIYGGNQAASTLNLFSDNNADSTTGSIRMTATPTVEIRSGASGNTYVPYTFGIGTGGGGTFTGDNVAILLTATTGGATAGFPSLTINNTNATHASIATVLYKAIRKSGQTGDLFQFLDSNGTTKLSYVDANGAFVGPMTGTGLSTFDHILIDNANPADVLLKMTPDILQTANVMEVYNYQNTHKDLTIGPGGLITVCDFTATDDDVRFQVRAPNSQTTAHNIFQVIRSYDATVPYNDLYSALTIGGDGAVVYGDNTTFGAAVKRLQIRQGSGQSVNMMEVVNTAGTSSLFTLSSTGQLTLADGTTPSKTLTFTMASSTASTLLTTDWRTVTSRSLIFNMSGASGTAATTLTFGTTSTARTITFPTSTSYTVAGLEITALQTWTGPHLFTGGSSGYTMRIEPATDNVGALYIKQPSLGTPVTIIAVNDSNDSDCFRVNDVNGARQTLETITFALWPSGIDAGNKGVMQPATLSANQVWTFPNASGQVFLSSNPINLTGQSGTTAATNISASPPTAIYLMEVYAVCTTGSGTTTDSAVVNIIWNDGTGARTVAFATLNIGTTGNIDNSTNTIYRSSGAIQYSITPVTNTGGTGRFTVRIRTTFVS